jgi:hypothetical protein
MKKILLFALVIYTLSSCFKEDEILDGQLIYNRIAEADLVSEPGKDYQNQLYFDLSSGELKAQNNREAWDFGFSCDATNPNIFTNSSLLMSVAATGSSDFSASFNPDDYEFNFERINKYQQKAWITYDFENTIPLNQVFIIDMGRDLNNQSRGFKLLQIQSFDGSAYRIKISDLDHSDNSEINVPINSTYNNLFVSASNPNTVLTLEPAKEEWDLFFTRYMERLTDSIDTLDYSVTGCLLNPYQTKAYFHEESYRDETVNYSNLNRNYIVESSYITNTNTIGHDWKWFDLDQSTFTVLDKKSYFIKDLEGIDYKLRFTGFYNAQGQKGAVSFMYLPL